MHSVPTPTRTVVGRDVYSFGVGWRRGVAAPALDMTAAKMKPAAGVGTVRSTLTTTR